MTPDNEVLVPYLKERHPGAFEGWDEFEIAIHARERKGRQPECLVVLYNDGSPKELIVDLHAALLITSDEDGADVIRVGKHELYMEWTDIYIPDQYREENLR